MRGEYGPEDTASGRGERTLYWNWPGEHHQRRDYLLLHEGVKQIGPLAISTPSSRSYLPQHLIISSIHILLSSDKLA